jgi:hypothetical protein
MAVRQTVAVGLRRQESAKDGRLHGPKAMANGTRLFRGGPLNPRKSSPFLPLATLKPSAPSLDGHGYDG